MEMFWTGLVGLTRLWGHGPGSCLLHDLFFRTFSGHIKQISFHYLLSRMCRQIITSILKDCGFSSFRESCLLQKELSSSVPAYSKYIKLSSLNFHHLLVSHSFPHQIHTFFFLKITFYLVTFCEQLSLPLFVTVYRDILCSCKQCLIYKICNSKMCKNVEISWHLMDPNLYYSKYQITLLKPAVWVTACDAIIIIKQVCTSKLGNNLQDT